VHNLSFLFLAALNYYFLEGEKEKKRKRKEINYLKNQVPLASERRSKFIPAGGLAMMEKASF
jgi:hypothetical protein